MIMQQHLKQKWKDTGEDLTNLKLIPNALPWKNLGLINPSGKVTCINKDRFVILMRKR